VLCVLFIVTGCTRALELPQGGDGGSTIATGCRAITDAKDCVADPACVVASSCCGNFLGCLDPKDAPEQGECPPGMCVTACLDHATPDACDADVNCHSTYARTDCAGDLVECPFAFAGCAAGKAVCESTGTTSCVMTTPDCASDGAYVYGFEGACPVECVLASECATP